MKKLTLICFALISFFACKEASKNAATAPTEKVAEASTDSDTAQSEQAVVGSFSIVAGGCLKGNEINAEGKIVLDNGKPPAGYEIQYLGSSEAKPVVVAKGLSFDADGSFKFKGRLPDGLPLNLMETGGNIIIVWTGGSASIYSGKCEFQ
jgi:hypothetical protein